MHALQFNDSKTNDVKFSEILISKEFSGFLFRAMVLNSNMILGLSGKLYQILVLVAHACISEIGIHALLFFFKKKN